MEPVSFGKYLLCDRLAEGGMAVVFRAKLIGPGGFEKELCIKQIREELAARPEFIELFVAEAKLTVSLTHANIVPVYELGMVADTYFLALELIDGPPLAKLIKGGPLSPPLAAYIVEQVLRGLDYAHRRGVVHRDLSAANVLVSRDGEVKIVDFGIAGVREGDAVKGGSRGYMAPEQERGEHTDARSDLYAVGVLLWELLAGRRWDGSPPQGPELLQSAILRATAPDPADRFPDAAAMLAQISRYLRDLSMGPTQAELSAAVRQRAPATPTLPPRPSDETRRTGPQTVPVEGRDPTRRTGPQTVPVEDRARQITFATRIDLPPGAPAQPSPRRGRAIIAAAALGAVGLAAAGAVWLRPPAATPPPPAPPPPALAAPPEAAPPRPAAQARLTVRTTPPGAEVRAGDRLLGATPLEVTLDAAGPIALELHKRGYQPLRRTVTFAGDPPAAQLTERLQPAGKGELTVNALPWAQVTIDGERRSDTPLVRLALPAGPHQVRLFCPPTGRTLRFTVNVEADREVKRLADLRGEPKLLE